MSKAAVVIGVDRVPSLPRLKGAASGAAQFAEWAKSQGFDTHLLTDADGAPVEISALKRVIKNIVTSRSHRQLLIHFSGHGILRTAQSELWLLSGAPDDPNEAVDVFASIWSARNSGIEHVVFFSDACRSRPDTSKLSQVAGSVMFPSRAPGDPEVAIDLFYATLPGDTANEVPKADAAGSYGAFFTECLLKGLERPTPELIEVMDVGTGPAPVVPAWRLKTFLLREVPESAAAADLSLRQVPQITVESRAPKFLARVPDQYAPAAGTPPLPPHAESLAPDRDHARRLQKAHLSSDVFGPIQVPGPDRSGIVEAMQRLEAVRGRQSFETRTGFTVVGSSVVQAEVSRGTCDVFAEKSATGNNQIRVRPEGGSESPGSVLIHFAGGTGTCLAILPDFIGTVVVEQGMVVTVNYTPSMNTSRYDEYRHFADRIEQRRAFVAAASRKGLFRLERDAAGHHAEWLREFKRFDPTLGLYAAYAYAQRGDFSEVRSVAHYMADDGIPALFDIALLDRTLGDRNDSEIFPLCPMLTQGWSILESDGGERYHDHRKIAQQLQPSLWTTLTSDGLGMLRAQLRRVAVN